MKHIIFIYITAAILLAISCKKQDQNQKVNQGNNNHHTSPVNYLRITGSDALLILSTASEKGWVENTDSINKIKWELDSITGEDEIFGFFLAPGEGSALINAGDLNFNHHKVYGGSGNDLSYLVVTDIDTFSFNTASSFASNWNVQGGASFPGFIDTFYSNRFPSSFSLTIDSVLTKSTGYTVNINPGALLQHADSLVYEITDDNDASNYIIKVMPSNVYTCPFTSSELSRFTTGTAARIDAIAYNYRKVIKNGAQTVYFINQRKYSNPAISVK
jgi:hypothetical protein